MVRSSSRSWWLLGLFVAGTLGLVGCGGSGKNRVVEVPPKVDLRGYRSVGLVEFACAAKQPGLGREATAVFLENVQAAQPAVRVVELGTEREVLAQLRCERLDLAAVRELRGRFGVDAVLTGEFQVSPVQPDIHLNPGRLSLKSITAEAYVDAALRAKLRETDTGATLWSDSTRARWNVATLGLGSRAPVDLGLSDFKDRYRRLAFDLAHELTTDFRPKVADVVHTGPSPAHPGQR